MAITKSDGSATISTTEFFLASNSTTQTPQTTTCVLQVYLRTGALLAGDQFRARIYETINGTQVVVFETTLIGVQLTVPIFPALIVMDGWEASLLRVAGTDRVIPWSLRKSA
jgi:hypothetical protein